MNVNTVVSLWNVSEEFIKYNAQPHLVLCETYDLIIECIIFTIFVIFGFFGNSLSIFCLGKDKSNTATPVLLISLEITETLFLLTAFLLRSVPTAYSYTNPTAEHHEWSFTYYQVLYPLARSFQTCSIYSIILVTINRYIAVCFPYRPKSLCSKTQAKNQILLVWILSILYNAPLFYEFQLAEDNVTIESRFSDGFNIFYNNVSYFLIMFLIPLISLILLNYNLIVALKKMKRRRVLMKHRTNKERLNNQNNTNRSEEEVTYVLIIIVFIFIFTQTPALMTQVLKLIYESYFWYRSCPSFFFFFERISDMLIVISSSINFIIYIFCSSRFFNILLSVLRKIRQFFHRNKRESTSNEERNTHLTQPCAGAEDTANEQTFPMTQVQKKF